MLLQFDGTLIVMAISFIVFMIIMQYIFYAPMSEVRENRENYIDSNKKSANIASDEAENLAKSYTNKITQARMQANNIVFEKTNATKQEKAGILQNTNNETNNNINIARENIEKDRQQAIETLKPEVLALAHSISTKVLGEEIAISGISQEMIDKTLNRESK